MQQEAEADRATETNSEISIKSRGGARMREERDSYVGRHSFSLISEVQKYDLMMSVCANL